MKEKDKSIAFEPSFDKIRLMKGKIITDNRAWQCACDTIRDKMKIQ